MTKMGIVECRDDSYKEVKTNVKIMEEPRKTRGIHITTVIFFTVGFSLAVILSWLPSLRQFLTDDGSGKNLKKFLGFPLQQSSHEASIYSIVEGEHPYGYLTMKKTASEVSPDLKNEAIAALHLALEMKKKGKIDKATKLFQHAYSLDPKHVDVLIEYGQHVEDHSEDVIFAEHLYTKALVVNPDHKRALTLKNRALPVVQDIDQRRLNRIDRKREELYRIPENHPGLRRVKQESYYRHIYHTVAIEGNTMTYLQARMILETKMAIAGKSIMEHNEVLGLDSALRYINSTLLRRVGTITLSDILEIHRRVLGYVDPTEAGRLRKTQVFIADYRPPHAADVPSLMTDFINWLNSEEALNLHPIEYAALAHYKLVVIHPFYDGNGRTARLLMNLILMQAGYPPVTIRVEEKHEYFQHIVTGNEGDIRPFVRFIARCTETALDDFLICSSESHDLVVSEHSKQSQFMDDGRTIIIDP